MKRYVFVLVFFVILSQLLTTVYAVTNGEEKYLQLQIRTVKNIEDSVVSGHFESVAIDPVRETVALAIGHDSTDWEIKLFDTNGRYLFSYVMQCSVPFEIEFAKNDGNLILYLGRSEQAFKIDSQGNLLEVGEGRPETYAVYRELSPTAMHEITFYHGDKTYRHIKNYYVADDGVSYDVFQIISPEYGITEELVCNDSLGKSPGERGLFALYGLIVLVGIALFGVWKKAGENAEK